MTCVKKGGLIVIIKVGNLYLYVLMIFLIIITLSGYKPIITIDGTDYDVITLLFIGLFIMTLPLIIYRRKRPSALFCITCFNFIIFYAFGQLLFDDNTKFRDIFPLLITFVCANSAYLISKIVTRGFVDEKKLITIINIFLSFSFVLYGLIFSFSDPTLSIDDPTGTNRLRGPLGGAAIIHLPINIMLIFNLSNIFNGYKPKLSLLLASLNLICVFLTGSRAGVATSLLIILVLFMFNLNLRRFFKISLPILFISIIIFITVPHGRLNNFEDAARAQTMETALKISTSDLKTFLFGYGYGKIWSWYSLEYGPNRMNVLFDYIMTPFGPTLYHPHSVFLEILTELGFISLLFFVLMVITIFIHTLKSWRCKNIYKRNLCLGVICTLPSFFADLYLFKNWNTSFIWWLFLFITLSLPYFNKKPSL